MRPISLEFQAFGPYAGRERIDFEALSRNGLLLICGETGSGKTMILDAMTLALYGKASGGQRNDFSTMRCNRCDPQVDTYIEFVFESVGNNYKFERRLSMKRVNLSESQQVYRMDEAGNFEPIKEKLNKTEMPGLAKQFIGFDYEQFTQVVVLPQGKFEQFLVSDSGRKGEILNEIFRAEKWGKTAGRYYELVKADYDALIGQKNHISSILIGENCADLDALKQKIEATEEALVQLTRTHDEADLAEKQNRLREEKETVRRLDALEEAQNQRQEALRLAKKATEKSGASFASAEQELREHESRSSEKDAWNSEKAQLEGKRELYTNADRIRREFDAADRKWDAACQTEKQAERKLAQRQTREQEALASYREAELEHRAAMDAFAKGAAGRLAAELSEGKKCPVCGSTHHPEPAETGDDAVSSAQVDALREALTVKGDAWETARKELERAAETLTKANQERAEAEQIRSAAEKSLQDSKAGMVEGISTLEELEQNITRLEQKTAAFDRKLSALKQAAEEKKISLAEARTAEAKAAEEADKAKAEHAAARMALEEQRGSAELQDAAVIDAQLEEIDTQIAAFQREQGSLLSEIQRLTEMNGQLSQLQEDYAARIPEAESALAFAKKLRGETSIGLERYVLKIMFAQVVQAANEMLKRVHGGRYSLTITEESTGSSRKRGLDLAVRDSFSTSEAFRPAQFLSGGEKFLVSLALSIGMSMIARTDGINIDAMFIDEGFGTLDEGSIGDALEVLESIRGGADSFVGIISHVQILRDSIPSKLIVHKSRKSSTLEYSVG